MAKTESEILGILNSIKYHDYWFVLLPKGDGFLLQLRYEEPDVETGEWEVQHTRKWYVSPHATESEIVRTAFLACMVSAEHRVREHFLYRGRRCNAMKLRRHPSKTQLRFCPQKRGIYGLKHDSASADVIRYLGSLKTYQLVLMACKRIQIHCIAKPPGQANLRAAHSRGLPDGHGPRRVGRPPRPAPGQAEEGRRH